MCIILKRCLRRSKIFKKEYFYDFIEKGYQKNSYNLAVTQLIKRLKASGNIEMANVVRNIQMNNATVKMAQEKKLDSQLLSKNLSNYSDSITQKTNLSIKGYESSIINSILLFGRPGTGKTFFVKQFCKVAKLKLVEMNLSSILDFRFGESIKKLELFIEDNKNKKQVIFFDEVDSVFTKRGNLRDVFETSRITTTMLQLLDLPRKALIIFSTNLINEIDKAIVRRFDIKIDFNQSLKKDLRLKILEDFLLEWNVALSQNEWKQIQMHTNRSDINISDLKLIAKRITIWKKISKSRNEDFQKVIKEINKEIEISKVWNKS